MLNRLSTRLVRPSTSLAGVSRLPPAARPSIRRPASTAHGEHGNDGHGGGHDDHFDPPGGWLWGVRPGEKAEKEGWEGLAWVYVGSFVVAVAAYTMKEDTSIQTWALEEARRRLEKEGFYEEK